MLTRRANFRDGPEAVPLPAPESLIFADATQDDNTPSAALEGQGLWPLTASYFETSLPFRFTGAQRRAIREILADLRARRRPMSRLLQGDVGSGKTVVAAAALLAAAANGYQGALMAPTEILAEQHYRGLSAAARAVWAQGRPADRQPEAQGAHRRARRRWRTARRRWRSARTR